MLKNILKSEVLSLGELVGYQDGQIASKTLVQNKSVSITLFALKRTGNQRPFIGRRRAFPCWTSKRITIADR